MRRIHLIAMIVLGVLLTGFLLPIGSHATDPSDADLCQIEPRSDAEIAEIRSKPVERDPTISKDGVVSATEAEIEGITRTVRELIACGNIGDEARANALFTTEFIADPNWSPVDVDEATPTASSGKVEQTFIGVFDVEKYADGRVGAIVASDDPRVPSPVEPFYLMFRLAGDRWLIDDIPLWFSFSVDVDPFIPTATPIPG